MANFLRGVPPVLWSTIIVFLFLFSQWLTEFFGAVDWVKALVGFIVIVAVPVLRLLGQGEVPAGRSMSETTVVRSRLSRWLWY
jgi:uncharacterized membrane protein